MLALHRPDSEPIVLPSLSQQLCNALDAVAWLPNGSELCIWERDIPDAADVLRRWASVRGYAVSETDESIRLVKGHTTLVTMMKEMDRG